MCCVVENLASHVADIIPFLLSGVLFCDCMDCGVLMRSQSTSCPCCAVCVAWQLYPCHSNPDGGGLKYHQLLSFVFFGDDNHILTFHVFSN